MFSYVQETYPIIRADVPTLLFPFKIPCIFDLCHHRDTPLILSSLQQLCSCSLFCPHFAETQNLWPLCSLTPFSGLFVQQSVVFNSFPCSWNGVILYLQNVKDEISMQKV